MAAAPDITGMGLPGQASTWSPICVDPSSSDWLRWKVPSMRSVAEPAPSLAVAARLAANVRRAVHGDVPELLSEPWWADTYTLVLCPGGEGGEGGAGEPPHSVIARSKLHGMPRERDDEKFWACS